jgi:hypothetical protein
MKDSRGDLPRVIAGCLTMVGGGGVALGALLPWVGITANERTVSFQVWELPSRAGVGLEELGALVLFLGVIMSQLGVGILVVHRPRLLRWFSLAAVLGAVVNIAVSAWALQQLSRVPVGFGVTEGHPDTGLVFVFMGAIVAEAGGGIGFRDSAARTLHESTPS